MPQNLVKTVGLITLAAAIGGLGGELVNECCFNRALARNPGAYQEIQNRPDIQDGINNFRYFMVGIGALAGCAGLARIYSD
jgi:hypothetical protein